MKTPTTPGLRGLFAAGAAALIVSACAGGLQPVTSPPEVTPPPSGAAKWQGLEAIRPDDWFWVLNVGREAFDWRLRAIDSAVDSIDLQTFIWELDAVGYQVRDHLLAAAARGVFVRVLHPPTPGAPGHEYWAAHCSAAAGLLSVEVDPRVEPAKVDAFVDSLKRFRIGWSWGGPISLAMPYRVKRIRKLPTPYQGVIVRLCIGLEDPDDLIADLEQAAALLR